MIRADARPEPAIGHGQVVRDEGMVDRDPEERNVRRPARLPAEPEPGVAEAGIVDEVGEEGGALAAVQVPHHDPRASGRPEAVGQGGELGHPAPDRWGPGMDQPEVPGLPVELDLGVQERRGPGEQPFGNIRLSRLLAEPEGQAEGAVRGLQPVRELLADLGQPVAPLERELDQADDIGMLATDQTGERLVIGVAHEHVGHQEAEPGCRTRVGRDGVRPVVAEKGDCLEYCQDQQNDPQPATPTDRRGECRKRDGQAHEQEMGEKLGLPAPMTQESRDRMDQGARGQEGDDDEADDPPGAARGRGRLGLSRSRLNP
jgi:hypothetical protein